MKGAMWSDDLLTGLVVIDREHEELVEILDSLAGMVSARAGGREEGDLLFQFVRRSREHFAHEEAIMRRHGYAAVEEHAREHGELLNVFSFLLDAIRAGQVPLDMDALDYAQRWLTGHIVNSDAALAHYVERKGGADAAA